MHTLNYDIRVFLFLTYVNREIRREQSDANIARQTEERRIMKRRLASGDQNQRGFDSIITFCTAINNERQMMYSPADLGKKKNCHNIPHALEKCPLWPIQGEQFIVEQSIGVR